MMHVKKLFKNWIIKIGENSVGKSLLAGMYDPEIPAELKQNIFYNSQSPKNK